MISQGFDDLDRVVGRDIDLAPGVGGDTTEAFEYDALGRLTEATDDDSTVRMTYDSLSRVLPLRAKPGSREGAACRARFGVRRNAARRAHRRRNRRTEAQGGNPLGDEVKSVSYAWDAESGRTLLPTGDGPQSSKPLGSGCQAGRASELKVPDERATLISQGIDDLDRLVGRDIDLGPGVGGDTAEAFAYDALGRLTEATDDDSTVQMTYDSLSRVLTEAQGGNPLGDEAKTVSYAWAAESNRTLLTYP